MELGGIRGDLELSGKALIGETVGEAAKHFEFAGGEVLFKDVRSVALWRQLAAWQAVESGMRRDAGGRDLRGCRVER